MRTILKNTYKSHKETIHNFIWRSLQIFGKQGITFLIFVLCAQQLGPYDFGIYNYALAIIFFLIIFGDFGISTATSKFVAEYNVLNKEKLKAVLFNSGLLILALTIVVVLFTILIGPWYFKEKYVYVLWLLPLVFLAPMTSLYDGIYRGQKNFKKLAIISLVVGFVSIFIVYYLVKVYGLIGALISQNIFYFILFVSLAMGYKNFHLKIDRDVMKEIGKYSLIIGIGGVGFILYSRIDVLFLGHFGYITEISYYEIMNKILAIILIPFTIIGQIISPKITEYYSMKKNKIVYTKFKKYLLLSFIISFLISCMLLVFGKYFLVLFFKDYSTPIMYKIFSLMLIVFFIQMLNGIIPIGFTTATGHAKLSAYFLMLFGIIHFILNIIFINIFGYMGILYSIIITKSIADLLFIFMYWRLIKC